MNEPYVSIIVPVYNVQAYITQCLDSLIHQTLREIEIICVDDCGTDDSMKIVRAYETADSRIRVLTHEQNRGLAAARNTGMQAVKAPYIMFCDSDDFYAPSMCEKMLEAMKSGGEVDMAMCGTRIVYECSEEMARSDEKYYAIKFNGMQAVSENILKQCDVSAWNKIYKRELIERHHIAFPEGLKYEDAYFFNVYAVYARCIYFLQEPLHRYRRRTGSIMHATFNRKTEGAIDHFKVALLLWDYYKEHSLMPMWREYMQKLWVGYLDFSRQYAASEAELNKLRGMVHDFLSAEQMEMLHFEMVEAAYTLSKERDIEKRYCCGLLRLKSNFKKDTLYFLGIPVHKIKYKPTSIVSSLFGIPYKRSRYVWPNGMKNPDSTVPFETLLSQSKSGSEV